MSIEAITLILAILTAVASGLVGSFALMRRMTLAGDAFSHVALPGIGLALFYSYDPLLGGASALVLGAIIIWQAEKYSVLNTEAIIGVLFSLSLAIGALLIEDEHELIEALFGGTQRLNFYDFIFGSIIAVLIIFFIFKNRRELVLSLVSRELAFTAGIKFWRLEFYFLVIFALTVILGMKFFGVLLMGALIIIPAASARNFARNLNGMLIGASVISLLSVVAGIFMANSFKIALGPSVIIVAGIIFLVTFLLTAGKK